jgi:hypothetical protein
MWKACPKCHALCPESSRFCPNCAPRGAAWQRWFRSVVGAAGLSVLGAASGCCETPVVEYEGPDSGLPDSGLPDSGFPDSGSPPDSGIPDAGFDGGMQDAGVVLCFCPILASYGNFGPCAGDPVPADAGCNGTTEGPTCHTCP